MKKATQQNSTESTLTPKQMEVIEAVVSGATYTEVATRAGIDRTTIYLWMKDEDGFKAQLMLARRECAVATRARLRDLADDAIRTVREVMTSKEVSESVRLKAALAVIQSLGSTTELDRDLVVIEKWREDSNPLKFF